jgi:multicomponent Na+:H+ antiporter subunit G
METIADISAILAVIIGTFFSITGVLGYFRFPDVYTRLHATGKVGVFGVVLLLVAVIARNPVIWGKALILIALLMIAGPVVSHTLGSAAYRIGIPLKQSVRDDLSIRQTEHPARVSENPSASGGTK